MGHMSDVVTDVGTVLCAVSVWYRHTYVCLVSGCNKATELLYKNYIEPL